MYNIPLYMGSRDNLVGIAAGYGMDGRGSIPGRSKNFFHSTASRPALGFTHHHIQRVPRAIPRGVKRLGRDADHSHPSRAEVKNAWSYNSTPPM
jgi:hypothetical protein